MGLVTITTPDGRASAGALLPAAPQAVPVTGAGAMSPADLAAFIGAWSDAAARLQATHEALHAEVRTLRAELADAKGQVERSKRLAALGEMAAGIAHEIRNPLGSIGLYARLLHEDLGSMPEQRGVARKIGDAVARLNAVVGDVLVFARETTARPTTVDAGELIDDALEASRGDPALWAGVEVRRGWASGGRGSTPSVACDPALVHQALLNVIRNALEAMCEMPGDSSRVLTVDARVQRVRSPEGRAEPMVALSVRDTGPGIPAEVLPRMFNPFFTTRAAGTGLGLAIVHRIMDAHGGRAAVRNARSGAGAIVELLLPARSPD